MQNFMCSTHFVYLHIIRNFLLPDHRHIIPDSTLDKTSPWLIPMPPFFVLAFLVGLLATGCLLLLRILLIVRLNLLRRQSPHQPQLSNKPHNVPQPSSLLVVLGSGGHTAEMLTLVTDVLQHTQHISRIIYVSAITDNHSAQKAATLHTSSDHPALHRPIVSFVVLPRAREVGQSFISSIPTSLHTVVSALLLVAREHPALVLANGPANSAVVAAAALLVRATIAPTLCRVIYVESFARVQTLSLSGKIVYWFADRFLVQWKDVHDRYPLSEYHGRVC